ncbi:MAG: FGGY-family carbohydrate kinase [Candidatus Limiplasma sp.]|nr:FGGY-family carbohydrate kinase [Candidatus Limiplasma sp.]
MQKQEQAAWVREGRCALGIELGSTRIKAVLIGPDHVPVAMGAHDWENRLEDGVWTYHLDDVWKGIQDAYADLARNTLETCGEPLTHLEAVGVSAMMHGYLPFDGAGNQLAPFRTWRNTMTAKAAEELTALFSFNIPQRWSIAHLYQAILNGEAHVADIAFLTTLAGYVHWKLTGVKVLGVGDASGMFPIDSVAGDYDAGMLAAFDQQVAAKGYPWKLRDILPQVLSAGEDAGFLTDEGAKLLDPTGTLEPGAPLCPPEGDAGTGMAATNSVAERTGNVSAGTSVFAMIVLEKPLSKVYPEIDMVTTPTGRPVAMVHCNNCTSDINAWAETLHGFAQAAGLSLSKGDVYTTLFETAMLGQKDCGGLINVGYLSGEPVTGLEEGRPMLVRMPDTSLTFANLARSLVYGAIVTLKLGMDILASEHVRMDALLGHGGFFKTPGTAQKLLAGALNVPVSVMATAGEGGPWGMALLAAYRVRHEVGETLEAYLKNKVFANASGITLDPDPADHEGFEAYTRRFTQALEAERAAVSHLK